MAPVEERILILAPRGRDAEVVEHVLGRAGIGTEVCSGLTDLRSKLECETGAVLITEEALVGDGLEAVLDWCEKQPPWSDLPFLVLATKRVGHRPLQAAHVLERVGNTIVLERPINAETLTSTIGSALRGRRRQYESRSLLLNRQRAAKALEDLNETLEHKVEDRTRELEKARETLAFALQSAEMVSWDIDCASGDIDRSVHNENIAGSTFRIKLPAILDHVIEDDRHTVEEAFQTAITSGTLDLDCRIRRSDGSVRWMVVKGRVESTNARPARMAGVVMDITERRLTEDALRQAQKMEAIGQLTGGVAHDFNNLLTVIVGGLDMMIRHPDEAQRVVWLAEAAMTAARRGEQLTQQLLAYSRRQLLHPKTVNPNRLLADFKQLAERAAGAENFLEFELDPTVGQIRVDPAQFESAVLNLIVNARDAMPRGGRIRVETRGIHRDRRAAASRNLTAGPYVVVSVTDDGIGMDTETISRAFEPFFTTKEVGKGSGLGLAQVYGFARSAGGEVLIESQAGSGTTVSLYFPHSLDNAIEETYAPLSDAALRPGSNGETILLVEDDAQVLDMAIESLKELNYKVVVARNAREALDHLKGAQPIDILFSDILMPGGMNGAQLAAKAQEIRPGMRVLLTSGYITHQTEADVSSDMPILNKPYRRDELARTLRAVLADVSPAKHCQ